MKRCPKCNRTYQDDAQKFCTHDGGLLVAEVQPTVAFDPNATIINEPPTETYAPPPTPQPPAGRPATEDLNKTIAGTMPPFPTSDFKHGETGPAVRPTSANLPQPPAQGGAQSYSAPLPQQPTPPQTPPPQYAAQQASSAPLSGSLPQQAQQQQQQQQPARKKSKLPLILGVLAVLLVLFVGLAAAAYFVVLPRILANKNANTNANRAANSNTSANTNAASTPPANVNANVNVASNENTSANANSNAASSYVAPFVPPPGSAQFVNSKAKLDGKLAEHYADFSFYYPRTWKSDPKSGVAGASNFVKVERMLPPDYTQESFAVAWYESGGTIQTDRDKFPKLVEMLNNSYMQFPEYHKVSEEDTKINSYDGHEFRFESISRGTAKGDIKLWGRIVFLPPGQEGQKNGVILLMLATSLAPEVTSVEDVGEKGEMPLILDSFRFGKTQ